MLEIRQLLGNRRYTGKGGRLLLVAEVGVVSVESTKVSIIGGCGAKEDARR